MSTNAEITAKTKAYTLLSWSVQQNSFPVPFESGYGIYLEDAEGKPWYDLSSSSVYANIGHQHPKIIETIKKQADKMFFAGPKASNSTKAACSEKIIGLLPDSFGKIFYTNGGADANENAIKFARKFTGRNKIFTRYASYHGATYGAMTLTGDPRHWDSEPGIPGILKFDTPYCYRCPLGQDPSNCDLACLKHFEKTLCFENPYSVAAVMIETITGTNGIIPPPEGYLEGLRQICDKYGILLIFDEVMCGWGRAGYYFAFEKYGVIPDIITTAKGLTSGYVPLGCVILSKKIAGFFEDKLIQQGLTYYGHTLAAATAMKVIDIYTEEGLLDNSKKMGKYAKDKLMELQDSYACLGEIRGEGLFIGIELVKDKKTREPLCPFNGGASPVDLISQHLLDNYCQMMIHWNVMLFCPPLVITKTELDKCLDIFAAGFKLLDDHLQKGGA